MSELSPDAFLEQAREYDAVPDVRDGLLKLLQLEGNTHPFAVVRFAELDRWARDGEYAAILAGRYPRRDDDGGASVTDEMRNAARSYQESWNRTADPFVGLMRNVAGGAADAGGRLFDGLRARPGNGNRDRDDS
jgi:hypothetical protein